MPDIGLTSGPKFEKSALVQMVKGLTGVAPNVIPFQTLSRLEATIEALAVNIEISGAQIKNAVLASIFIARRNREPLAMTHLLSGVERELRKEGRSLGAGERERLARDA